MNHKLQLDIDQIENVRTLHPKDLDIEQEEEEQFQEDEQEGEEEQHQEYEQYQDKQVCDLQHEGQSFGNRNSNLYEGVQTFGNTRHPFSKQFLEVINPKSHLLQQHQKQRKISDLLAETPIQPNNSSKNKTYKYNESQMDDEVNRIINKVMNKSKPVEWLGKSTSKKQVDKISKIDKINKELMNQNAHLIGQINQLEKKLGNLINKGPSTKKSKKKKEENNSSLCQDKNLMKTIKQYKERLAKALDLNSRLSSRLITQKSKSNIISNTQRSIINKEEYSNTEGVNAISTIRSQSLRQDKKGKQTKEKHIFCQKCCQEVKKESSFEADSFKRSPIFSPVLQVKNYEIASPGKGLHISQFDMSKIKNKIDNFCQVRLDEQAQKLELLALQEEEKELQKIFEANNKKIEEYEQSLFNMIDLS